MAGRFSVEAVFKAVDRITAPVNRMQNRVGKFTRKMNRGFTKLNRVVGKFAAGIKKGAVVAAASLFIISSAMRNVLGAGADFEQAITNVGAVTLQTRAQIKDLEKLALKLGRTTKFTATQSAQAMEIMARAGFTTNQILTATPAVLDAAAASGLSIAEVANVVSNALKGMGLEASQAGRVADILALASARTNSTMLSLGDSLRNVASTARQLNIPIEETVAAIALLQDVGLDASTAGTAFNVMLTKMAAPSASITKKMKKFGISFKDAKGNMLPLNKVLEQLNIASKKAGGNFDKIAFLAELVGLRGQKAAANLGELFEKGKLGKLTKQLKNASGSAKKMAAIRMTTLQGSLLLLGSAVDAVKVKIFNLQNKALKDTVDKMTKWVSANEDLIATKVADFIVSVVNNMADIVKWAKRIGIGLLVFFAFATILKVIIGVMTVVNLVMAANPVVLIVLAVLALIAAFAALIIWMDEISDWFDKMPLIVKILLGPLFILVRIIKFIKDNIGVIGNIAGKVGKFLGFGGDDDAKDKEKVAAQVVSPQDRIAKSIEEKRTTSTAEVTLKTEKGIEATVTSGKIGPGLRLQSSGAL